MNSEDHSSSVSEKFKYLNFEVNSIQRIKSDLSWNSHFDLTH